MNELIKLSDIVLDAGTQVRAAISEAIVTDYAERMAEGVVFPPVVVFHDGSQYYMADGFHRGLATQRNGGKSILVDVRSGTKTDALWFALGANRSHGQKLSQADKRRAVEIALKEWPDRSAGSIAEHVGVDRGFVNDMRKRVDLMLSPPSEVIGRDGKNYPAKGQSRVQPEKVSAVSDRLRAGEGVANVAKSLRMSTRTVQKIRAEAGIPEKRDRSRAGAKQRRADIRDMADRGFTTRQIASQIGITEDAVGSIAKQEGITIHADRAVGPTKRHDSNRIVERMVGDAENLTADVNLIEFSTLDPERLKPWLASLADSKKALESFIRRLQKEQQRVQVA